MIGTKPKRILTVVYLIDEKNVIPSQWCIYDEKRNSIGNGLDELPKKQLKHMGYTAYLVKEFTLTDDDKSTLPKFTAKYLSFDENGYCIWPSTLQEYPPVILKTKNTFFI